MSTGIFTAAQEAQIKDVHNMVSDFKTRLLPLVQQQQAEVAKFKAVATSIGDKIGNFETEYKRQIEDALRTIHKDFAEFKGGLDAMAAKQQGMMGVDNPMVTPEFMKSFSQRVIADRVYSEAKGTGFRYMKPIEFDDADQYAKAGHQAQEMKWTEGLTGSSVTSLRDIQSTTRLQEIFAEPLREERVWDYFPRIPVSSNSVEYWQQTDFGNDGLRPNAWLGNEARTVAEGTAKPYSTMTGQAVTTPIRTLAHIFVMSEQLLQDAPAFARHVDVYMRGGLEEKVDIQLLKGSNTGSDLDGLMLRSGIQSYIQSSDPLARNGDTILDMVARAASKVKRANHKADGLLVGIGAGTEIKLTKGNDGQYVWGAQALQTGQLSLWGLPVLETGALEDDEGLMGAFRMSVGILDRMMTALRVSDSHDNLFELNMVALRYELRIGLMVVRLKGLCKLLFDQLTAES